MNKKDWVKYFLLSSAVGVIVETISYLMQWWVFDPWWIFLPWSFVWEGLFFGTLAYLIRGCRPGVQYLISAAAGGTGEVVSAWFVPFWVFPEERLLFVRGLPWIVLFITLVWGTYCPLLNLVMKKVFRVGKGNRTHPAST